MLGFGFLGFRGDSGEVCGLGPRLQGLWKRTSTNERDATSPPPFVRKERTSQAYLTLTRAS